MSADCAQAEVAEQAMEMLRNIRNQACHVCGRSGNIIAFKSKDRPNGNKALSHFTCEDCYKPEMPE